MIPLSPSTTNFSLLPRLVLAAAALLHGAAHAREIVWSPEHPLAWDDFEASVPRNAASDNVAVTMAILRWTYEYDVEYSPRACTYRITGVSSRAVFDTEGSWVRSGHRTADVLAHEQGHFDITRIHELVFDAVASAHVGSTGPCRGGSVRRASDDARSRIAEILEPVYDRVWQAHLSVQATYDAQTRHGMDAEAQRTWLELIDAGLRGRRWDELGTLAPAN